MAKFDIITRNLPAYILVFLFAAIFTHPVFARENGPKIEPSNSPPQYEVFEGVAVQFDGKVKSGSNVEVTGYEWKIISGTGGSLLDANSSKVTFVAPGISSDKETFILELTTTYKNGKTGRARMNILVHKRPASEPQKVVKETTIVRDSYTPWVGFGLGYIWSRPIYVPIYIPCPECYYDWMDLELAAHDPILMEEADRAMVEEAIESELAEQEVERAVEQEVEKEVEREVEKEVEREIQQEAERVEAEKMIEQAAEEHIPPVEIEPVEPQVDMPMDSFPEEPVELDMDMDMDLDME